MVNYGLEKPSWMRSGNKCIYNSLEVEIHSVQVHINDCIEYAESVTILITSGIIKKVSPYDLSKLPE